ncbi:MAG: 3-hydroxyacyl-CoA dehydrogenase [Sneathiella sp.]|uniref:3-hydroxyacyl-CoA dehydrogenase NAD-binding domain-containing protein n=1 Tax=Sneathiella sp. TaxID=1964365 RepID=UPI000C40CA56|nr:3-hydroxyacyl-CoA dehydrogenase NAD-binding domain-containing protein [Sneathiella sp.]MAL77983.1 3-hydroxyacyl-CoA dehydrogenase [Sneathiella sp.]
MTGFIYEKDADGIVTITMDMPGQSANTMSDAYDGFMSETISRLEAEDGLTGVVIASAKNTFFAGADLNSILDTGTTSADFFVYIEKSKGYFRRIEKLPVPVVAAINGAALGGGYELCLACNRRIVVDNPKAIVGLPEVTLGLLPGAGGVVRLTALLGLEKALPRLLEGKPAKPADALKEGMVDEMVGAEEQLVPAAKAWIKANPDAAAQPWDRKGFKYPGGNADAPNVRMTTVVAPTLLYKKTRGRMPAPEKILDIAVNSMRMGFDSALRAESRGICKLITTPEARAAIGTFFFGLNGIKNGKHRPAGDRWQAGSSAILGAGMMGAGIAFAHAARGLPAWLKDMDIAKAEKGKAYSEGLVTKGIKRGQMDEAKGKALLDRIKPTENDADYKGADIIIEAVFEDIALKEKVIPATFKQLGDTGIYGSNTSTLPISLLAESCPDPSRFIGIHFFSPVDKMQLVELIVGEKTSEETVRKAYDYVMQIGKTPIIVNDSRGFFTSRVFGTYTDEGASLVIDGVDPVLIERAAWLAGMPVGPLAVSDEVSLILQKKVYDTHQVLDQRLGVTDGYPADMTATVAVTHKMVEMERGGRQYGGGFYDYGADGGKSLWPGIRQFARGNSDIPLQDVEDRLIYRQVIETLRCYNEGVLRNEVEANVGSIFGIGFPAYTGGALQFVQGVGVEAFAKRAGELTEAYGDRFALPSAALDKLREDKEKAA